MVTVYKTNNKASQDAIQYLEDHHIDYEAISYKKNISSELLLSLFEKSIDGIDPLLSKKSNSYAYLKEMMYDLKLSELIKLILNNPTILKTPILVDEKHIVVGFSKHQIRIFFPRNK